MEKDEVAKHLQELDGWELEDIKIRKTFKFDDFAGSMAFVSKLAAVAEEQGHHPDMAIHYNKVEITLWTHSIGGLSINDFILAAKIDEV